MKKNSAQLKDSSDKEESLLTGVIFTCVQVIIFFSFVLICAFNVPLLDREFLTSGIPLSFILGMLVIVSGIILTAAYVAIANRATEKS
ncbi:DUF485 domain-containing protein [Brenneria populi subsp. brevivirga]|uniref:DUF485 domain-containing protein n=1 Tax=Brenneria populi TaxID=1505588 RepID=UPI002E16BD55|nr:DUF485 domain-containing protein [Brenneria populi subsp. brevivirga]